MENARERDLMNGRLHTPTPPEVDPDAPLPEVDPGPAPDDEPEPDPSRTPEGDPPNNAPPMR
jgi:hypothetical protein